MHNANIEMRVALISEIEKLMEKDKRIVFVDADLGKARGTLKLREKFQERTLDVGVAEQNMASVAAGLSSYGFIPFISSFTSFATRRIADQIAISISYAGSNVKIIGLDPGITAELNGGTHMSFEDVGIIRSIPGTVIFEPVDVIQLVKALPQIVDYKGVIYIRLFRKKAPKVFNDNYEFNLFKADVLKEGNDVSIFATGITVNESMKAVEILNKRGIDTELINVHTIKPIDKETIVSSIKKTKAVVTCENHNIFGGLRSAVAEVMTEEYLCAPFKYIGVHDCFGEVGKYDYLIKRYKLSADDIVEKTLEAVSTKKMSM